MHIFVVLSEFVRAAFDILLIIDSSIDFVFSMVFAYMCAWPFTYVPTDDGERALDGRCGSEHYR
jgi:hypothetical protein